MAGGAQCCGGAGLFSRQADGVHLRCVDAMAVAALHAGAVVLGKREVGASHVLAVTVKALPGFRLARFDFLWAFGD